VARAAPLAGLLTALLAPAIAAAAAAAAEDITPFRASYEWLWHGAAVAISTLQLVHREGDVWVYSSSSEPRGLGHLYPMQPPRLQSVLRITDQGVQPLSFHADAGSVAHNADVSFDWQMHRATGVYEGASVDLPISNGVQDDLSVQIALIVDLLRGQTPENLSMIDKDTLRDYRYQREGQAAIDTALGHIDTVIYSSQHPGSPRVTRFWCAPSAGYLPVRVEQKRLDSVEWSMQIRSLQRN
jgi:hypothetical protein